LKIAIFAHCVLTVCEITRNSEKIHSISRSSNVIQGANRKRTCNFLLVITIVESLDVSRTAFEIFTHKMCFPTSPLFDTAAQEEPVRISGRNPSRKS